MSVEPVEPAFGPYEVHERLGIGGMAMVHRAKKLGPAGFERAVALKRMLSHLAEDASFVESFIREAKVASLLVHPNIAQVYDFGRIQGVYYIAMELVAGFDVRKLLRFASKVNEAIPLAVVLQVVAELCDALEHAHAFVDENGQHLDIVHRDVSPSNMIVAHTGHLKVIDFGIAKASSHQLHTDSGKIKGKLGYMSPEAVRGMQIGPESDVFSAGVVAWELITASPLFSQRTDYETMRRIREGDIVPPSRLNPGCPPELDDIVLASLSRDPTRRPTAGAMRSMIGELGARYAIPMSNRTVAEWILQFAQPDAAWARASASSAARSRTSVGSAPPFPAEQATSNLRAPVKLARSQEDAQLATELWGDKIVPTVGNLPDLQHAKIRFSTPLATEIPPLVDPQLPRHLPEATPSWIAMPAPRRASASHAPKIILGVLAMVAAALATYLLITPSAQPAAGAKLRVRVTPTDATIAIGGKEVARGSSYEAELAPGVHAIEVTQDGFEPWTGSITVREGETQAVQVALERAPVVAEHEAARGERSEREGKQPPGARSEREETPEIAVDAGGPEQPLAKLPVVVKKPPTVTKKPPRVAQKPEPDEPDPPPVVKPEVKPDPPPVVKPDPPPVVKPDPPVVKLDPPGPPKPARTPIVPPDAVTKVSGDLPAMKVTSDATNADVLAKLCIDAGGRVSSVNIIKSMPELVADLRRALGTWRYKPFLKDGTATPVCFMLSRRVVVKRAN